MCTTTAPRMTAASPSSVHQLAPFLPRLFSFGLRLIRVLLSDNRKVVATGVGATLWGDRPQTQATGRR